ncbi:MAG: 2-dehydro-3-deoxyphosphooctonate aldolase [Crocinitomix sp.]|nr:2-dehydro-3-deoxyphosphooctonate aldolase [Crocinitomix sp.]
MKKIIYLSLTLIIISCGATKGVTDKKTAVKTELRDNSTFLLKEISTDPTYGLDQTNPIEVGGVDKEEGPLNEQRFLNALAGPNGEKISYYRAGSCCAVESENGFMGVALLDNYRVTWDGTKDTVSIYINMYDYGLLKAPVGFTIR